MTRRPFILAAVFAVIAAACINAPVFLEPAPRAVEISGLIEPRGPIEGLRGRFTDATGIAKERTDD